MPDGGATVICTLPENPFTPLAEICADCDPPGAITRAEGSVDNEKSGEGPEGGEPDGLPPPQEENDTIAAMEALIAKAACSILALNHC
jgi:hypothetical protein